MQPVPKAAYRSDFRENTNFCPQRDWNLGVLAQQASVLPLDHCDMTALVLCSVTKTATDGELSERLPNRRSWLNLSTHKPCYTLDVPIALNLQAITSLRVVYRHAGCRVTCTTRLITEHGVP